MFIMKEKTNYNETIRRIRLKKGWSQEKVCSELEKYDYYITRSAYANYELGIRQLSALAVEKLARCFGVSSDYILGLNKEE